MINPALDQDSQTMSDNIPSDKTCRHCGKSHGVRCPEVKALEYFESGELKRVEFMTPADYLAPVMPAPLSTYPLKPTCGEWLPNPFPLNGLSGTSLRMDQQNKAMHSQGVGYESPGGFKRALECEVDTQTIYGAPEIGVSGK